jgi:hypothetical protein
VISAWFFFVVFRDHPLEGIERQAIDPGFLCVSTQNRRQSCHGIWGAIDNAS